MDPVILLLLTFILSVTGLGVFIWSLRRRVFDEDPAAASVIFSEGEIGRVEDPSATPAQRSQLQKLVTQGGKAVIDQSLTDTFKQELAARVQADQSTAYVTFVFLSCAVVWL